MGNPIVSSEFVRLFDENIREVAENRWAELPDMLSRIYGMVDSKSAWEEFYSVGDVPDIQEWNGELTALGIAPGYHTKIEHKVFANKLQYERKLLDDKKFGVFDNGGAGLMESAHRVQNKYGARPFNNAFSSSYDFMTSEEGLSLCNTTHTNKSGASTSTGFGNSGTSSLDKTSLAATRLLMRQFKSDIGERINVGNRLGLVIPENLEDTANEIIGTPFGFDTAGKDKNMDYKRYEVITFPLLDDNDSNNWFMVDLDQMKRSLKWFNRIMPELKSTIDFQTYMTEIAIYMRFSYGFVDWRWIYGHNVS